MGITRSGFSPGPSNCSRADGTSRQASLLSREHAGKFQSGRFHDLFQMIETELPDESSIGSGPISRLRFPEGVRGQRDPGENARSTQQTLRRATRPKRGFCNASSRTVRPRIPSRSRQGRRRGKAISTRRSRRQSRLQCLAQSAEHIVSFFSMLSAELGFYLGGPRCTVG